MARMTIPEDHDERVDEEMARAGMTRRVALSNGAKLVAGASIGAQVMAATGADAAFAQSLRQAAETVRKPGYGKLRNHFEGIMSVPDGFHVTRFGAAGTRMSDGLPTPNFHDGTTIFGAGKHRVRMLRNHEGYGHRDNNTPLGPHNAYDRTARGGVTTTLFDTRSGKVLESALVLNGTDNNCNGGKTPWGSWLSCEESCAGPSHGFEKPHGYVFEVPANARGCVEPVPIKAMGRFEHEACAIDHKTGIVYMTEDNGDPGDGFYRYIPNNHRRLHQGGKLQMLRIREGWQYNAVHGQKVGRKLHCSWVNIKDPDPPDAEHHQYAVYHQGREKGAARFEGLEGCHFQGGSVYFVGSEAGDARRGQIWRYTPHGHHHGTLVLLYESPGKSVLDEPDSLTVSPRGGVVLGEDGDGEERDGGNNFLRVLTPAGRIQTFARCDRPLNLHRWEGGPKNAYGRSEWSGVCYSPNGKWLFTHLQYPGESYAITGPWHKGWA